MNNYMYTRLKKSPNKKWSEIKYVKALKGDTATRKLHVTKSSKLRQMSFSKVIYN